MSQQNNAWPVHYKLSRLCLVCNKYHCGLTIFPVRICWMLLDEFGNVNVCCVSTGLATTNAAGVTVEIRGDVCIEFCEIAGLEGAVDASDRRGDLILIPRFGLEFVLLLTTGSGTDVGTLTLLGAFVVFCCEVCCICRKFCIPCSYRANSSIDISYNRKAIPQKKNKYFSLKSYWKIISSMVEIYSCLEVPL